MKRKNATEKDTIASAAVAGLFIFFALAFVSNLQASELVFKFKSPSFSGIGTGAHYLTVETKNNQERKL